jgi:hypothetical protein
VLQQMNPVSIIDLKRILGIEPVVVEPREIAVS